MFEQLLLGGMVRASGRCGCDRDHSKEELNLAKASTDELLNKINSATALPLSKTFAPGAFVTQVFTGKDEDGHRRTHYRAPLPGQPAVVVGSIPETTREFKEADDMVVVEDMVIRTVAVDGKVHEFMVCSRFFDQWKHGQTVDPEFLAEIEARSEKKADDEGQDSESSKED